MSKRDPSNPAQFSPPSADRPTIYIRHISGGGRTLTPDEVQSVMVAILKAVPGVVVDAHETPLDVLVDD